MPPRHIKEHMGEYYEEEKEIDEELESDEALRFHYFKLHDYNNDNKLDGLELYSAINHFSEHGAEGHGDEGQNPLNVTSEEQVVRIVDMVLQMDDKNNDGFVDYFEFSTAMEEAKEAEENPNEI